MCFISKCTILPKYVNSSCSWIFSGSVGAYLIMIIKMSNISIVMSLGTKHKLGRRNRHYINASRYLLSDLTTELCHDLDHINRQYANVYVCLSICCCLERLLNIVS